MRVISAHATLPLGGLFIAHLSLFFLICVGDSAGTAYRPCVMSSPETYKNSHKCLQNCWIYILSVHFLMSMAILVGGQEGGIQCLVVFQSGKLVEAGQFFLNELQK